MNPQPLLIVALFDEVPVRLVLLAPFKGGNVRTKERKREPVNRLFNSLGIHAETPPIPTRLPVIYVTTSLPLRNVRELFILPFKVMVQLSAYMPRPKSDHLRHFFSFLFAYLAKIHYLCTCNAYKKDILVSTAGGRESEHAYPSPAAGSYALHRIASHGFSLSSATDP